MPAPPIIFGLVARFSANLDSYKRGQYNETQVRREFIDPFFEALGWDVTNRQGYAEAYKDQEVAIVEETECKADSSHLASAQHLRQSGVK